MPPSVADAAGLSGPALAVSPTGRTRRPEGPLMTQGRPKILLTSVVRPFGPRHGDAFSTTAQALWQQLWAQDVFRVEDPSYHWGLDVIAANIQAPTVVLHYPTLRELSRELRNGYDYVGVSFNPPTFHKLQAMVPVIREHAPNATLILGGYGTALRDDELEGMYDLLCREEGIRFFRRLLGEEERPFKNPVMTFQSSLFSLPLMKRGAPIFGGVGCKNGCDFCMTSAYFKKEHHRFQRSGDDMFEAILEVKRADPRVGAFVMYDEDLLLDKTRGMEFLEACRRSDERFSLSVFGSVKALSQYEPTQLAEMGISMAWIGFEGMQAGYDKQKGVRYDELFAGLNRVGISVAASMIIGFDYQTPDIIEREYAELMRLRPTVCQFLIYGPSRGSALYDRLEREGRLTDVVQDLYPMMDGFTLGFHHPNISAPRLQRIAADLYRGEYEFLGPTVYRSLEVALKGYRTLKDRSEPRLRLRAEIQKDLLRKGQATRRLGLRYAPNTLVRTRIAKLFREIDSEIGPPPPMLKTASHLMVGAGAWTRFKFRVNGFSQVSPRRNEYNFADGEHSAPLRQRIHRRVRSRMPKPFGTI